MVVQFQHFAWDRFVCDGGTSSMRIGRLTRLLAEPAGGAVRTVSKGSHKFVNRLEKGMFPSRQVPRGGAGDWLSNAAGRESVPPGGPAGQPRVSAAALSPAPRATASRAIASGSPSWKGPPHVCQAATVDASVCHDRGDTGSGA